VLTVALALLLSQYDPASVEGPLYPTNSRPNPGFQLFPANGVGAGTECAGTVPTGKKSETITFSRAGAQTCTRANGNVVKLTANQPVVESLTGMALSDGNLSTTGGQLGMLDEASVANNVLQSEALDNVAWTLDKDSAPRTPTVTANAAAAPDGTITAERVQFVATSSGISQFSGIFQANACPAGTDTGSFYVKSHDGVTTGVVDLAMTGAVVAVSYSGSWTRVIDPGVALGAASVLEIGNLSVVNGGLARNAADLDVWGAQCEISPYPSSYIPTTTVAVTRSATSWTVDTTTFSPAVTSASGCFGADAYFSKYENVNGIGGTAYGCGLSGGATGGRVPYEARIGAADYEFRIFDGANQNTNTALNTTYVGSTLSLYAWWKTSGPINSYGLGRGTDQASYTNNLIGVGGAGGTYQLGHTGAGCGANTAAWLTRVRMDTDSSGGKCR
jgi:hypothetical protein